MLGVYLEILESNRGGTEGKNCGSYCPGIGMTAAGMAGVGWVGDVGSVVRAVPVRAFEGIPIV